MNRFFSRTFFLFLVIINTVVSISFYIELREARECIHLLTIDNARLRKHIKYLEKQIDLREDEISFIGYKYDSLRFELKKLENNKEK